jgi:hypothetical protein
MRSATYKHTKKYTKIRQKKLLYYLFLFDEKTGESNYSMCKPVCYYKKGKNVLAHHNNYPLQPFFFTKIFMLDGNYTGALAIFYQLSYLNSLNLSFVAGKDLSN